MPVTSINATRTFSVATGQATHRYHPAKPPGIPWKQIAGMRDRLIHHYFSVDLTLVWQVVECDLCAPKTAVEALL
jgi:uncharacterized protein with HEPN domain